jgi:hypothetical protein
MAKPSVRAEVSSFIKGFITEASPLAFPPDATTDEENFELNRDGTRERRLGLALDPESVLIGSYSSNAVVEVFDWDNVLDFPDLKLIVLRTGIDLYFFSKDPFASLGSYRFWGSSEDMIIDVVNINGRLVVTRDSGDVVVLTHNGVGVTDSFFTLETRDFWGIYENNADERTTALSVARRYNLNNQGWEGSRLSKVGSSYVWSYPPTAFFNHFGEYPSDSDILWTGIQSIPFSGGESFEVMAMDSYDASKEGSLKAPKGSKIVGVLSRGTSRGGTTPEDRTVGGPTCMKAFAGRVFYGGFSSEVIDGDANSPNLSNYVFFSQLVLKNSDIGKCYQEGDPTSREYSDILDTDGGYIPIPDAGSINGFAEIGQNLIIFSDRGVWALLGGSDYGFTASNYKTKKLSNFGLIGRNSVVQENNRVFYWAENGINAISFDNFGELVINNVSETTIQQYYNSITREGKEGAKGIFDPSQNKIIWMHSGNKELRLDLTLGAFYKYSFPDLSDTYLLIGSFLTPPFDTALSVDEVVVSGDSVQVVGEEVVISNSVREPKASSIKYLIIDKTVGNKARTASLSDTSFKDYGSYDAKAYLTTGAITGNDTAVHKQVPYLMMHFRRTESGMVDDAGDLVPENPSSCLVRSQWDWSSSSNSNKWSPSFQAYRERRPYYPEDILDLYDTGFDVITSKNKLRGRGRAFSLYMETEPEKDCRILGWNLTMNGNSIT